MYASLCDFVCIALLLPFVLGFCLSSFCLFNIVLVLVTTGRFAFWFGCSLLSSFFKYFLIYFILS